MRYLVRLTNSQGYMPRDVKMLQAKIRELLGSAEKIRRGFGKPTNSLRRSGIQQQVLNEI